MARAELPSDLAIGRGRVGVSKHFLQEKGAVAEQAQASELLGRHGALSCIRWARAFCVEFLGCAWGRKELVTSNPEPRERLSCSGETLPTLRVGLDTLQK